LGFSSLWNLNDLAVVEKQAENTMDKTESLHHSKHASFIASSSFLFCSLGSFLSLLASFLGVRKQPEKQKAQKQKQKARGALRE
jgi:hypothetical protein